MEMVIAMSIVSILLPIFSEVFISGPAETALMGSQRLSRDLDIGEFYGFMRATLAQADSIGLADGSGVEPLSIAGDQFIFQTGRACYRVFYIERLKEIRASTADSCSSPAIQPTRGPNELFSDEDSNGDSFLEPGDPHFDPAIDSAAETYGQICLDQCAFASTARLRGVLPATDAGVPITVFGFKLADQVATAGVDTNADSSSENAWYDDPDNAGGIACVHVTTNVEPIAVADSRHTVGPQLIDACSYLGP